MRNHKRLALFGALVVIVAAVLVGRSVLIPENPFSAPAKTQFVSRAEPANFLHTDGNKIVDSHGKEVVITGINWFGMETGTFAPHGLWSRNWEDMLDQIAGLGFNAIRLPYSNQMFDPKSKPRGIDWKMNPDLKGLTGQEIMDKIIYGAGQRGLRVILDRHRPSTSNQSQLWYEGVYDEERWIKDWQMLAKRYRGNDTVIGADLHNEPDARATWGDGDPRTDWRLAAERAGNAILDVNPDWLILVEGILKDGNDWYWQGGHLKNVRQAPVRLKVPNKLVYSPHDYGPGVWAQGWFKDPTFPNNLPKVWGEYWLFIHEQNIAPVLVGEFGGRSVGNDTEGIWQRYLVNFLKEKKISYTYWAINPNSGDVGGLLKDDWETVQAEKMEMLSTYQMPTLSQPKIAIARDPKWQAIRAEVEANAGLKIVYRTDASQDRVQKIEPEIGIQNDSKIATDLSNVELSYWFTVENGDASGQVAEVTSATMGAQNVRVRLAPSGENNQYRAVVTFTDGAGKLPAESVGTVKLSIRKGDGSWYSQGNDYSFLPITDEEPDETERIGLYLGGKKAWGMEPQEYQAAQASANEGSAG